MFSRAGPCSEVPALKYVSEVPSLSYTGAFPALSYSLAVHPTPVHFLNVILTPKYVFQQIVSSYVRATRPANLNILLMLAKILVMQHCPGRCLTTDYYC